MKYSRVKLDAIGYEIAPVVVSSAELEGRLKDVYGALHLSEGQLESLTGIVERRWWEEGHRLSDGAIAAAHRALETAGMDGGQLDAVIYAGVCREYFEPATACRVAAEIGVGAEAVVYDLSNACLGVLNGMIDIANRIELGQIQAGIVVSCESAREINDIVVEQMLRQPSMDFFKLSLATLTGGSGAVAVVLSDGSFSDGGHKLVGAVSRSAPRFHGLCRWGVEADGIGLGHLTHPYRQFTATDSGAVLSNGVALGIETWRAFLQEMGWSVPEVDRVICHQIGSSHRDTMLKSLGIPHAKEFATFAHLGNIGTVSLPMTAAIANDREFLNAGDRVAFLGIGSGLNCLMMGLEW